MSKFNFDDIERDVEKCQNLLDYGHKRITSSFLKGDYSKKRRKKRVSKKKILKKRSKSTLPIRRSHRSKRPKTMKFTKKKKDRHQKHVISTHLDLEEDKNEQRIKKKIDRKKMSKEDRLRRLYKSKAMKYEILRRMKKELDEKKFRKDCPFQPQIRPSDRQMYHRSRPKKSRYPQKSNRSVRKGLPRRRSMSSIFNYLHHTHDNRNEELESLRLEKENQELSKFHFRPHISTLAKEMEIQPIHERVGSLQREKNQYLRDLQDQHYKQFAFRPNVNSTKNLRKVAENNNDVTVTERERIKEYKEQEKRKKMKEQSESEYTYNPMINRNSERIVKEKFESGNAENKSGSQKSGTEEVFEKFFHRQNMCKKKLAEKKRIQKIKFGHGSRSSSNFQKKKVDFNYVNKLAIEDKEKRDIRVKYLKKKYVKDYSFNPNIDARSRVLGKTRNAHELYDDVDRKKNQKKLMRKKMKEMKRKYSFKPKLISKKVYYENNKYRIFSDGSEKNVGKRVNKIVKRKEDFVMKEKRKKEKEFNKKYSFKPKINKKNNFGNKRNSVLHVNGLDKYLQKFAHAKMLKEEKKKREIDSFKVKGPKRKPYEKFTRPKPFALHSRNSIVKSVRELAELKYEKVDYDKLQLSF